MAPVRRLPLQYSLLALIGGLLLFVVKARVGELDGWGWDAVADVFGVLGGVALAGAGINEIVLRLTEPDWVRRTAPVVGRYRQVALDDVRLVLRAAAEVAGADTEYLDDALLLPRSEAAHAWMERLGTSLRDAEHRAAADDAAAKAIAEHAQRVYPPAVSAASRCLAALQQIATLRPELALQLEDAGTDLDAKTRDVEASALAGKAGTHLAVLNLGVLVPVERVLDMLEQVQVAERRVGITAGSVQLPR